MSEPYFLITGHGRSGTHYMARLFQWFGFNVGEYKKEKGGMAHNFPPDGWPFDKNRGDGNYMIQVVRDPWKVVDSVYLAEYSLPKQNSKHIPEIFVGSDIDKAMRSVVLWNRAVAEANPDLTVKVEEAPEVCAEWFRTEGLETKDTGKEKPLTNVNNRVEAGGWDLKGTTPFNEASDDVADMFREHCRIYGYPTEPKGFSCGSCGADI